MKVYLDEDLSPVIAALVRKHGIDATAAYEVGNVQLDDRAQLAYAAREGRAIVTANVVDFIELAHEVRSRRTPNTQGSFWSLRAFVQTRSKRLRIKSWKP